jgi:hypothetical protein
MDKDKFITPVYTLIRQTGFKLKALHFGPDFAV